MDLNVREVSQLLRISEPIIIDWVLKGDLPSYKIGDQFFFSKIEIEDWMLLHQAKNSSLRKRNDAPPIQGRQQYSLFRAISKGGILNISEAINRDLLIQKAATQIANSLQLDINILTELLIDREELMSTAIGNGIAVPHTRESLTSLRDDAIFVTFLNEPIPYGALDGRPVHTLFFLLSTEDKRHLHLLAKLAYLGSQEGAVEFFQTHPDHNILLTWVKDWETQLARDIHQST